MKLDLDFLRVCGVAQRCSIWKITEFEKPLFLYPFNPFFIQNIIKQNKILFFIAK